MLMPSVLKRLPQPLRCGSFFMLVYESNIIIFYFPSPSFHSRSRAIPTLFQGKNASFPTLFQSKTIHFSTLFQNSLREKIGRISDSTATTMSKKVVMAVLSLHNSSLCYLCSGKVRYATTWTYGTVVWHIFCPSGASTLLIRGKHRAPLGQAPCPIPVFLFSLPKIVIWLFDYLRNKWQAWEVSYLI